MLASFYRIPEFPGTTYQDQRLRSTDLGNRLPCLALSSKHVCLATPCLGFLVRKKAEEYSGGFWEHGACKAEEYSGGFWEHGACKAFGPEQWYVLGIDHFALCQIK